MVPFVGTFIIFFCSATFLHSNLVLTEENIESSIMSNEVSEAYTELDALFSRLRTTAIRSEMFNPELGLTEFNQAYPKILADKDRVISELKTIDALSSQDVAELDLISKAFNDFYQVSQKMMDERMEGYTIFLEVLPWLAPYLENLDVNHHPSNAEEWPSIRNKLSVISEGIGYKSSGVFYARLQEDGKELHALLNDMEALIEPMYKGPALKKLQSEFIDVWRKELSTLENITNRWVVYQKERARIRQSAVSLIKEPLQKAKSI
jgi:methyl-accepting chemotaxis protein